jgi:hypothetical protein
MQRAIAVLGGNRFVKTSLRSTSVKGNGRLKTQDNYRLTSNSEVNFPTPTIGGKDFGGKDKDELHWLTGEISPDRTPGLRRYLMQEG